MKFTAIADWASDGEYTVAFMCAELGVSRSGFYAWQARAGAPPGPRASYDERLTQLLISLFTYLKGNPGVRRLHADLRALGHRVSRKRVHRLMKAAGLRGRAPKAWRPTTTTTAGPAPAPDLIGRRFTAEAPNQAWCGDITYIKTWQGWAYLATVIDLHSRALVGWAIADHARTDLVTTPSKWPSRPADPAPAWCSTPTEAVNTRVDSSSISAAVAVSGAVSDGPAPVSITPCPNRSTPHTRKNSSTRGRGLRSTN